MDSFHGLNGFKLDYYPAFQPQQYANYTPSSASSSEFYESMEKARRRMQELKAGERYYIESHCFMLLNESTMRSWQLRIHHLTPEPRCACPFNFLNEYDRWFEWQKLVQFERMNTLEAAVKVTGVTRIWVIEPPRFDPLSVMRQPLWSPKNDD